MTGFDVVERALTLLNYTTPTGVADAQQNAEQLRRGLPIVNTVLVDICHIRRVPIVQQESLADPLPVDEDIALRVMVPGVAMYLAQTENDGDNYNRYAAEYSSRRSSVAGESRRVQDTSPRVWM